ncbi:hypothetical protein [Glaciecola sp. KUL10]|uniref:hypothetical protein n=1 Tax=Glaciecola sp. (strain KUL10) TaxID=2161813 RepID=UPI000D78742D|nr:hypothetical protein [Glaciecola sp. KUL10]GBL05791.1 ribonuclease Z [Glaciecola sp. KUL10]
MITEISNEELFGITKRQIKLKIIKMLQIALDNKSEKIAALRDNDVELENYAVAYSTLNAIHTAFNKPEGEQYELGCMNERCFTRLKKAGVSSRCISNLEFYKKLSVGTLHDSVNISPIMAKVTENGLEVKLSLSADGYCCEIEGITEQQSTAHIIKAKVTTNAEQIST